MAQKRSILFVCTHNSIRSQIAEGYMRDRFATTYDAYSAGTDPTEVHPLAVQVMKEIGIDISNAQAKPLIEFFDKNIDVAITVCDSESGACPMVPGAGILMHQSFPVPSCNDSSDTCLAEFRTVRDLITAWIDKTFT